jgi:PAS domain S-box-containing protein
LGEPFEMEYRYLAKDGRVVWVIDRATLRLRDGAGNPMLFEGVMLDVTMLKDAQSKAQDAEIRYQEVVELGPAATYALDFTGTDPGEVRLFHASPRLGTLVGYPISAWIDDPMRWFEWVHPDDRGRVLEEMTAIQERGDPFDVEYRMIAADGNIVWVRDQGTCVARDRAGKPARVYGYVMDITAARRELDDLRHEIAGLNDVLASVSAIAWIESIDPVSKQPHYLYLSTGSTDLLGWTPEELLQESSHFLRLVHPDDVERVLRGDRASDETGVWEDTYRVVARDGAVRWFHARGRRATTAAGGFEIWHGLTIDVTDAIAARDAADEIEAPNTSRSDR